MSRRSRRWRPGHERTGIDWSLVLLTAAGLFVIPGTAHAYLDPASGSLFLQLLLGGIAGAALALKLFWRRITGLFSRKSSSDDAAG